MYFLLVRWLMAGMLWFSQYPHPFYLSVTELAYDKEEKVFQGSIRVFTNDMEDALTRITGKKADLLNAADTSAVVLTAAAYLKSRFSFAVDGEKINWQLLGYENEEEATWFYIETGSCSSPKQVRIINNILCDFLPQQMNIVHLLVNDQRKSGRINCPEVEISFEF